MTILTMTATFGGLRGETLTLRPGLNLIELENEGGKSTWCAFLRAMLYGLESRKGGQASERNRFTPWSGAPMAGTMDILWQGKAVTLRRFPKGANPFGGFEAVYTGTREPVPGLTAENVGETLLGVSKEVFERTVFIPQGGMTVDKSGDLEKRIAALATSGEEDVSFSQTERKLKDWKNARQANRSTGAIPRIQAELTQARLQQERVLRARDKAREAQETLSALEAERKLVEQDLALHTAVQAQVYRERYVAARDGLAQAQAAHDALRAEVARFGTIPPEEPLREAQGELAYLNTLDSRRKALRERLEQEQEAAAEVKAQLDATPYAGLTGDEAVEQARTLEDQLTAPKGWKPIHFAPFLAGIGVWIVFLILGFVQVLSTDNASLFGIIAILIGFIASSRLLHLYRRQLTGEQEETLARYQVDAPDKLLPAAQRYALDYDVWQAAVTQAQATQQSLDELEAEAKTLLDKISQFVAPFGPDANSPAALAAAVSRALTLEDKLRRSQSELDAAQKVWEANSQQGEPGDALPADALPQHSLEEDQSKLRRLDSNLTLQRDYLAQAQGEEQGLGDYAALSQRVEELSGQLEGLEEERAALELALDGLTAANAQLQTRFSPAVNLAAGEYLAALTGGKYQALAFDRDFQAQAQADENLRAAWFLSQGTADQVYLALRLAISRLTLPQDDPSPLVLDDALVTFDDRRLKNALNLLQQLAQERQILLFTCQSREKNALHSYPNAKRPRSHRFGDALRCMEVFMPSPVFSANQTFAPSPAFLTNATFCAKFSFFPLN